MRWITCLLLCLFIIAADASLASPATEAATDLKGFFGESLVDDIYQAAGRKLIPYKMNPTLSGPDRLYLLENGTIEVHEIKAYSGWAGKAAMKTTSEGTPTYELSARWCKNWITKTLSSSTASSEEKSAASTLSEAIKNNKVKFIFDEVNLTTQQFKASIVEQVDLDDVVLSEKMGPTKINRFNQFFSRKTRDYCNLKIGYLERIMKSPSTSPSWQTISRKDQIALIPEDAYKKIGVKEVKTCSGLMTADGRLLISIKAGAAAGFMVFAADSGHAVYQYLAGDILKPELEDKIVDAALRGVFVGACVGVTVFLGAAPGGWVVLAVAIGSYFVIDTALQIWRAHQDWKHLTIDDLRGWGITTDTPLSPPTDSILKPKIDTTLEPVSDSLLF